jgi:uncharacterized protein YcfJ
MTPVAVPAVDLHLGDEERLLPALMWAWAISYVVTVLVSLGCAPHPGCDVAEVEASFARVLAVHPQLDAVVSRMEVRCVDDTDRNGRCRRDVDACTTGIGAALGHEGEHWAQLDRGDCTDHSQACGWDAYRVEEMQR